MRLGLNGCGALKTRPTDQDNVEKATKSTRSCRAKQLLGREWTPTLLPEAVEDSCADRGKPVRMPDDIPARATFELVTELRDDERVIWSAALRRTFDPVEKHRRVRTQFTPRQRLYSMQCCHSSSKTS